MGDEYLQDAKEWLDFAETDYGVATKVMEVYHPLPLEIICFHFNYADTLTPYGIAMRYPHELFLEERHAKKAIEMAEAFILWAKESVYCVY